MDAGRVGVAGVLTTVTLLASACFLRPEPISSQEIDLKADDLVPILQTRSSETVSANDIWALASDNYEALTKDDRFTRGLDNGVRSYYGELKGAGNTCITPQVTSWVMSFRNIASARRTFEVIAMPIRAYANGFYAIYRSEDRVLTFPQIGDESRVYDLKIGRFHPELFGLPDQPDREFKVIARQGRVVVVVEGKCHPDPRYFARLAGKMIGRARALERSG